MGKTIGAVIAVVVVVVVGYFLFMVVDVDQTQEGALPEVSVEGGQLPEADVDVGDVDVGTEEQTVEVPTIDVTPPADDDETPATPNN